MAKEAAQPSKTAAGARPLVEFTDVHKKLGGRPILDGLTFDVKRGETFVIIGYSGTGKSVTLRNLIGLMKPDKGSIRLGGEEVTTMKPRELENLRRNMGVLFQSGALINWLSIYENVELPLIEHTRHNKKKRAEIIKQKLELVNLWNDRDKPPSEISGGMKKRAGLARAIALDPELVLYDEPTSGLDPVIANEIDKLIITLRDQLGMTSIVVTHDMESAYEIGSRIAMFYHGKMIQIGTPDEIRNSQIPEVQHFISGGREGALSMRSRAAVESGKPPVFSLRQPVASQSSLNLADSGLIAIEDIETGVLKRPEVAPALVEASQQPSPQPPAMDDTEGPFAPETLAEVEPTAAIKPPTREAPKLPDLPEIVRKEVEAARARVSSRNKPTEVEELSEDLPEIDLEPHNDTEGAKP
ncbi:MAG: ABC transporter ATP-binding protein [Planctomycetes bacterium]|nr:ABC transporter ATP-binding protein [Planctomycetota bacterium]